MRHNFWIFLGDIIVGGYPKIVGYISLHNFWTFLGDIPKFETSPHTLPVCPLLQLKNIAHEDLVFGPRFLQRLVGLSQPGANLKMIHTKPGLLSDFKIMSLNLFTFPSHPSLWENWRVPGSTSTRSSRSPHELGTCRGTPRGSVGGSTATCWIGPRTCLGGCHKRHQSTRGTEGHDGQGREPLVFSRRWIFLYVIEY